MSGSLHHVEILNLLLFHYSTVVEAQVALQPNTVDLSLKKLNKLVTTLLYRRSVDTC
jgi:hypothetical protein